MQIAADACDAKRARRRRKIRMRRPRDAGHSAACGGKGDFSDCANLSRKVSEPPAHPWSASENIPTFYEPIAAPRALPPDLANLKEDGGSLTPRSHFGQINTMAMRLYGAKDKTNRRIASWRRERRFVRKIPPVITQDSVILVKKSIRP
ncbi:hypothetical protein M2323_004484 [Rhodoblastus acidophilus]|uniref:hypothetical protein n=1 Tax=Rhodoblastus acidophilus TaxID=1074 RepID=UPI0022247E01|nr:hypothetical protein [Rhodoblastus acidophilus]MCW2286715.1 hypothetical protein [Rhodoblastus acidophilus]MCW2335535.1 hypothetical protein [Rhodoblastus acidophilus]